MAAVPAAMPHAGRGGAVRRPIVPGRVDPYRRRPGRRPHERRERPSDAASDRDQGVECEWRRARRAADLLGQHASRQHRDTVPAGRPILGCPASRRRGVSDAPADAGRRPHDSMPGRWRDHHPHSERNGSNRRSAHGRTAVRHSQGRTIRHRRAPGDAGSRHVAARAPASPTDQDRARPEPSNRR